MTKYYVLLVFFKEHTSYLLTTLDALNFIFGNQILPLKQFEGHVQD